MVECEEEPVSEVEAIQRSLEEAEEKARQAVARQQQLDELASKLTEWNSKLEQKVTELEVDLIRKVSFGWINPSTYIHMYIG